MPVITLTSDYGEQSHYLAMVKGHLYAVNSNLILADVSHHTEPFDIIEAAYVFNLVYPSFGDKTIHIFDINAVASDNRFLCAALNKQFILLPDNGALSLIAGNQTPQIWELPEAGKNYKIAAIFMANEAIKLINSNYNPESIFKPFTTPQQVIALNPVISESRITGTVMYTDSFGNAHTNISKTAFEQFTQNKSFRINLSKHEWVEQVSDNYWKAANGEPVCTFNNLDLLMISVVKGRASQLLNLIKNKSVTIELA